ncbi:hypothetical protein L9F63_018564, partial [Diploptera punctata]
HFSGLLSLVLILSGQTLILMTTSENSALYRFTVLCCHVLRGYRSLCVTAGIPRVFLPAYVTREGVGKLFSPQIVL